MEYSDEVVGQIMAIKRKLMTQGKALGIDLRGFDGDDTHKDEGDALEEIYILVDKVYAAMQNTT